MKGYKLAKNVVNLRIMLQNICEGYDDEVENKKVLLTMRIKVLFFISNNKNATPMMLIENLGLAKSNLALLCKSLIEEELIISNKNETDKRNIYYVITEKGLKEISDYYDALNLEFDNLKINDKESKIIEKKLDDIILFINKKTTKKK
jgi:DNA-binding MarR family transcriptional regulator